MRWLRRLALLIGFLAFLAPMAHLLESPNKLHLDGSLWLAVQQHLYNGCWPPTAGARDQHGLFGLAVVAYSGMLLSFFLLNAPVNEAVNKWTPETLPMDWASYRLRWKPAMHSLPCSPYWA